MKLSTPFARATLLIFVLIVLFTTQVFSQTVNPVAIVNQQCPCNGPVSGGIWQNHGQYMKCVTDAVNELKKNNVISPNQSNQIISDAANSNCGKEEDDDPEELNEDSPGILTISGANEKAFNPNSVSLTVTVTSALFSLVKEKHSIDLNNTTIHPSNFIITPTTMTFPLTFINGLNELSIYTLDSNDRMIEGHYLFWAGSGIQQIRVVNNTGLLVNNAKIKVALSDDTTVFREAEASAGVTSFSNVPSRTLIATASGPGNLFGSSAFLGNSGTVTIVVKPISQASSVDNNDFSLGLTGWSTGSSPVTLVLHQETNSSTIIKEDAVPNDAFVASDNVDLRLSTSGTSPQLVSRTFVTQAGTKNVTVRYRFVTSEVPGGFFGSQFNDYYSVAIRSQGSGKVVSDQNSMNGLGLAAFTFSTGATAWKEITLPVSQTGDVVQVDAAVSNVGDGLFQSQIEIDFVSEKKLSLEIVELLDPDQKNLLQYLSIDNHSYNSGKVPVFGRMLIKGAAADKLTSLKLELSKSGSIITTVNLDAGAQTTLFQNFGADEQVELNTISLLYNIPSLSPIGADGNILVKLIATTEQGESISKDYGSFKNLMLYKGTNRYGTRDATALIGGDDWGRPSTIAFCNSLSTDWTINDISNMNGNEFKPHSTHRDGIDMDVYFTGYNARDEAVANKLIAFLNGPLGSKVEKIYVTYTMTSTDVFYNAIKDKALDDLRKVIDIIRPVKKHDTHFHILVKQGTNATQKALSEFTILERTEPNVENKLALLANNIKVFPNPTSGMTTISINKLANNNAMISLTEISKVIVYSKTGLVQKMVAYSTGSQSVQLDLSLLPADTYFIEVHDGDKKVNLTISLMK